MMFLDGVGEQSCTAGLLVVHHGAERLSHGPVEGRNPRCAVGMSESS